MSTNTKWWNHSKESLGWACGILKRHVGWFVFCERLIFLEFGVCKWQGSAVTPRFGDV